MSEDLIWNPRFAAWAKAHGHSPETVLDHLPLYEFPIWNRGKLVEFSKISAMAFTAGGLTDHDAYDVWLAGQVEGGDGVLG